MRYLVKSIPFLPSNLKADRIAFGIYRTHISAFHFLFWAGTGEPCDHFRFYRFQIEFSGYRSNQVHILHVSPVRSERDLHRWTKKYK